MADYQVTCITRDGKDSDRRIDRLGGTNWNDSIDDVIGYINRRERRFWTTAGGRRVLIVVKRHPVSGREYLATEVDGYPPNNLLSLPECNRS